MAQNAERQQAELAKAKKPSEEVDLDLDKSDYQKADLPSLGLKQSWHVDINQVPHNQKSSLDQIIQNSQVSYSNQKDGWQVKPKVQPELNINEIHDKGEEIRSFQVKEEEKQPNPYARQGRVIFEDDICNRSSTQQQ